jgi:nucleotide-binding universal stress UspA family protein
MTATSSQASPSAGRIVVGYDGSVGARAALDYAAAGRGNLEVVIVYGYGPPADWLGTPNLSGILENRRDLGRRVLDELLPASAHGYATELIGDSPARALVGAARRHGAEQIVVGARGFGRLHGALGSVSHELLHTTDRPVVIVPAGSDRLRPL